MSRQARCMCDYTDLSTKQNDVAQNMDGGGKMRGRILDQTFQ